jgi:hypothetical protein
MGRYFFLVGFNIVFLFFCALGLNFEAVNFIKNMSKPLDPFWVYGIPEDGTNRQKLNCKLCGVNMSGGICRLKYHLAKIPGHDVDICDHTTRRL